MAEKGRLHGEITIEIPLRITISAGAAGTPSVAPRAEVAGAGVGLESVDIDPNYGHRRGYDENFLGHELRLPVLCDEHTS